MDTMKSTIAIIGLVLPMTAGAASWTCEHNNLIREVSIDSAGENTVPCSVNYTKITEGVDTQQLWSAQNEAGYCEARAEEFIAKLESWGWNCSQDPEPVETGEPESTPME